MGFTIKTIVGTGENSQYVKLADDLIKRSSIYRHLCRKIFHKSKQNGLNVYHKNIYRNMYKGLMKEFKLYERDTNRIFKKQEIRTKNLEKKIQTLQKINLNAHSKIRSIQANARKQKKVVIASNSKNALVKRVEGFFSQEFSWRHSTIYFHKKVELMIRAIVGYKELENENKVSYYEFLYLAIGHQLDAFSKDQIMQRFGADMGKSFTREVNKLIKQGYIRRFDRKALFYVTDEGKARFTELTKSVFLRKFESYWERIFK